MIVVLLSESVGRATSPSVLPTGRPQEWLELRPPLSQQCFPGTQKYMMFKCGLPFLFKRRNEHAIQCAHVPLAYLRQTLDHPRPDQQVQQVQPHQWCGSLQHGQQQLDLGGQPHPSTRPHAQYRPNTDMNMFCKNKSDMRKYIL